MDLDFWQGIWDRTGEAVAAELAEFARVEGVTPPEMARRLLLGEVDTPTFVMSVEDRFPKELWPVDDFHVWMHLQQHLKESRIPADTMS